MGTYTRDAFESEGTGAGDEFRRVAEGVTAERRWSATARRWSHRSLQEPGGRAGTE